ncbi:GAF domain-containing protein [Emticicia sp. CRIBPO]|uniref:GAF domain-containing protein n=1 Tax=Emticicia sp. CRIBPO TaxID=2683258 RepID=UPI0014124BC7|nr:GAF domain-containing protein [Emticicia sp. CRIBPO]NBA85057.1 GAF domain-containing protein [Emticicia sp. CRIBPO]
MSETLWVPQTSERKEIYEAILPQVRSLLDGEKDRIANMANVAAALKEAFGFFWVGFYVVKEDQLVLGPFQGPIACTRINFNRGVCGHCYTTGATVIVPDVEAFPGHIACSSASKSEIVVPVFDTDQNIIAVLDVDSDTLNDFSEVDAEWLEKVVGLLSK